MLLPQDSKLLVSGYVRSSANYDIPRVLINLCLQYFIHIIHMNYKGKKLKNFLSMKHGETFHQPFITQDVGLISIIAPNGYDNKDNDEGYVQFFLRLQKGQTHISQIAIYFEMYCPEINTRYTRRICHSETGLLNETDNIYTGWNPRYLALYKCKNEKALNFYCYTEILEIKYKDKSIIYRAPVDIEPLPSNFETSLKISSIYFSSVMDTRYWYCGDHWKLALAPGPKNNAYYFGVRIYRLPMNVESVSVKTTINISYGCYYGEIVVKDRLSYTNYQTDKPFLYKFIKPLNMFERVNFTLKIKVLNGWDLNKQIIPKKKWKEYGIH